MANSFTAKLGVANKQKRAHMVWVEPWANDYTLLEGEELELLAFGATALPYYHIIELDGATQIYCENSDDFLVTQNGVELKNGHNRQPDAPY